MPEQTAHVRRKLSVLFQNIYFRAGLATVISAVTLILAVRNVTLNDFWTAIKTADTRFVALAFGSVAANNLAKTIRWKVLLGEPGRKVSLWIVFQAILVGQTLNTIYPARVGDLSRVYIVGDRGPGRMYTLGSIVLEKVLDTLFYASLVLWMLIAIPLPGWVSGWANKSGVVLIGASLASSIILLVMAYRPEWFIRTYDTLLKSLSRRWPAFDLSKTGTWFRSGIHSLEVLRSGRGLIYLIIWMAAAWVTALLNNQLVLLAFGIHLPLTASLLVLVVLQAGISIPSIPGRIGVFEYICVLTLGVFGISQSAAFSYGVLLHSLVFIPPTLLGLFFLITLGLPLRQVASVEASRENQ
jgi:glycosyltransferase 2 family protein